MGHGEAMWLCINVSLKKRHRGDKILYQPIATSLAKLILCVIACTKQQHKQKDNNGNFSRFVSLYFMFVTLDGLGKTYHSIL